MEGICGNKANFPLEVYFYSVEKSAPFSPYCSINSILNVKSRIPHQKVISIQKLIFQGKKKTLAAYIPPKLHAALVSYNDVSIDTNMRKAYLQNNAKCLDLAFSRQLNNERIKTNVWMEVIFGERFVTICQSK